MRPNQILKELLPPVAIRAARSIVGKNGASGGQSAGSPQQHQFVRWLRFANAGMLQDGNIAAMSRAIANLPPTGALLEIGSFCGLSTNVLAYLMGKFGVDRPLFTCDKWQFEGAQPGQLLADSSITHDDYREFVRGSYLRNVQTFSRSHLPHTIEAFSDDFFRLWKEAKECTDVFGRSVRLGGPLSFAYIDGNHTYDFAKRDFSNCDAALVQNGFILFDDSSDTDGFEGVRRVIQEIRAAGKYEIVEHNPNYLIKKLTS